MRSECVKGPFVTALPMTLSGIVKGINTLRARDCQSFSFFLVFFLSGPPPSTQRTENKTQEPVQSATGCVYPFFSVFRCILYALYRPSVTSKLRKIARSSTTLLAIRMVLFSCYSSRIIFFNRVSSYSFSNCYKTNLKTYRLEIFK